MPVDSKHPDYCRWSPAWKLMRDCSAGQRAIHAGGEAYLPKLSGESDALFTARIKRTAFFNATYRTIEGYIGFLFRKEPTVSVSAASERMLADVTKSGQPFTAFARRAAWELETPFRLGVLVDYPRKKTADRAQTVKQAEAQNIRPHMALYVAESIINWAYSWINNKTELSLVVLEECVEEPDPADRFKPQRVVQYRVLELVPVDAKHHYRVQLWRKPADGGLPVMTDEFFPLMQDAPLTEIPFEIFGDGEPGLEDLANVNVSHYQTTADLEHGAHKTALPQPWISGLSDEYDQNGRRVERVLTIGGGDAWTLPTGAQAGMLEYTGQGLQALENRLAAKEQQMAVLGARMLEQQKRGIESAEAAGIHRSGEQSVLQDHADLLSQGFTRVLGWFDKWAGGSGEVSCAFNKDFLPTTLSAQEITARVAAWQSGAMSEQELFESFQNGGVVRDDKEFEEHQTEISTNPPALLAPPTDPNAGA